MRQDMYFFLDMETKTIYFNDISIRSIFFQKNGKLFWQFQKKDYLCTRKTTMAG
jgi:hypothetical protein